MQKNKLNLPIYGIHLLNPNKTVVLEALFCRSLPLCSPYHTSQQAADLVVEPAIERPHKRERPTSNVIFTPKKRKTENESK